MQDCTVKSNPHLNILRWGTTVHRGNHSKPAKSAGA